MCKWCFQDVEIGKKLKEYQNGGYVVFYKEKEKGEFENFFSSFDIAKECPKNLETDHILAFNISKKERTENEKIEYQYIANHVPDKEHIIPTKEEIKSGFEKIGKSEEDIEKYKQEKEEEAKKQGFDQPYWGDFHDIAECSAGNTMLGILKGDVDNLGQIFALGLERENGKTQNSIEAQVCLSKYFDLFFSGFLNDLVKNEFQTCYINYAGGDDFVIIGPWNDTIVLAKRIQKEFSDFVGNNPDITLSVGIAFCKAAFPVFAAIDQAEKLLERAKEEGKNRVCFFDTVLEWREFGEVYEAMTKVSTWVKNSNSKESEKVSYQFARSLAEYGSMISQYRKLEEEEKRKKGSKEEDKGIKKHHLLLWQPQLAYNLARNITRYIDPQNTTKGETEQYKWVKKIVNRENKTLENSLQMIDYYVLFENRKS